MEDLPQPFVPVTAGLLPHDGCGNRGSGGLSPCLSKVTQIAVTPTACPGSQEPERKSEALPARLRLQESKSVAEKSPLWCMTEATVCDFLGGRVLPASGNTGSF